MDKRECIRGSGIGEEVGVAPPGEADRLIPSILIEVLVRSDLLLPALFVVLEIEEYLGVLLPDRVALILVENLVLDVGRRQRVGLVKRWDSLYNMYFFSCVEARQSQRPNRIRVTLGQPRNFGRITSSKLSFGRHERNPNQTHQMASDSAPTSPPCSAHTCQGSEAGVRSAVDQRPGMAFLLPTGTSGCRSGQSMSGRVARVL